MKKNSSIKSIPSIQSIKSIVHGKITMNTPMIIRRLYVTLMELIIVIAILSLVTGFLGINIVKAMREQRFKTELSQLVDQLRLAQDLMLIFNSNVQVIIKERPEKDGIDYFTQFETPLPSQWSQEINRPHEKFTAIQAVNFDDLLESEDGIHIDPKAGQVSIKFLSGGTVMSRGAIRVSTSKEGDHVLGALTRYICLPGKPAPITVSMTRPDDSCFEKDSAEEQQMTRRTKDEILVK